MLIPSRASGTATFVSTDSSGTIPTALVWSQLIAGKYDIIVDVNGNGRYDVGIDALDSDDIQTTAGFYVAGGKPTLTLNPAATSCRKYGETFTVQVNILEAYSVEDFRFEIYYNATLLDVSGISWSSWGTGTYATDEMNGILTGYTSGSPISTNTTLIAITFIATYNHIWKDENTVSNWKNNQTGTVFLQWANLSYPSSPDLRYEKGGLNQINVGSDFGYTFSPIQGDLDNNGLVEIYDLRTVAVFFDQQSATYSLTGDNTIDIYDLVAIGANFGYSYSP
jgi:hypothetical protein